MRRFSYTSFLHGLTLLCLLVSLSQTVAASPQRIISLAPHITEMVYALGAGERLVAVSDHSDYPAAALQLPRVNSFAALNIEAILALKPDVVIAWRSGNPEADLKRLQQFGIRVLYSDPLLIDDIATELLRFGQLLGQAEQGSRLAQTFRTRLATLRTQYAAKTPIKVFFAMSTAPLTTVANNAWPAQVLADCAADNIFADALGDYPQPYLEQVLMRQPQVIVQTAPLTNTPVPAFWQTYHSVPAVANQAFITLDADTLYRAGPRILDAMQSLCQALERYR